MTSEKVTLLAKHAIQYYLVGATGVLVNLGILYLLKEVFGFWYLLSSGIAIYISMTTNFILNKKWTFRNSSNQTPLLMYSTFIAVSVFGMVIQLVCNYALVELVKLYYLFAAIISIGVASGVNFILNRHITFGIKL